MRIRPALWAVTALVSTASLSAAPMALADDSGSDAVVISEVYGGGGNSGARYSHDFVELFNRSDKPVDLTGYTVTYYSSAGSFGQRTDLKGTIAAGGSLLVQQAAGANDKAEPLPTPDVEGETPMSSSGGRVVVTDADGETVDLLGWGRNAKESEGDPAPGTTNMTSVARTNPCVDTDDNAADFTTDAPSPQNSSAEPVDCEGGEEPPPPASTIAEIQGAAHRSPLEGSKVYGVRGVVTAVSKNGFWMQSLEPDDDPATSEGIFVYTGKAPTVEPKDVAVVDATVSEYRPGGNSGLQNLSTTQLASPTVETDGTADLPKPVRIGEDRMPPQQNIKTGDPGTVEEDGVEFSPETDAIDFFESMEGMRVGVSDAEAVGPSNSYGELPVVAPDSEAVRTGNNGVRYTSYDQPNSMRIQLDDMLLDDDMVKADTGDVLAGTTVGVFDYSFANYKLHATRLGDRVDGGATRDVTRAQDHHELAISSFNVENLHPGDHQSKFDNLAGQVVENLQSPDLIALEEVQDDSGPKDDGKVNSKKTTDALIKAIKKAGGPTYKATWIDPEDKADGGQPGGNIRVAYLYREDRGLCFIEREGGDATTATEVKGKNASTRLSVSPGRINPTSDAFADSRKPLAGEFVFRGKKVFVVANHFSSKGGDDPLFGRFQQPVRHSEADRHAQAQEVRGFVDELMAADANAKVVVLGDVNDFEFSKTTDILTGEDGSLIDLPQTVDEAERYTYNYQGNSQVLDHILISKPLAKDEAAEYEVVHTNSDFHDQDSDHDPAVVRLDMRGR